MQMYQGDPEFRKLKGQKAQNFMENVTMEAASRMLNRAVMDRLKAIAIGQGDLIAEPAIELNSANEAEPQAEPTSEPAPTSEAEPQAEPASEPEVEPAEDLPAEDKPAEE
jgi:hypothetical protein